MTAKKQAKKVQADLMDSAHKIWLAGLGAFAMAEEEGGKLFKGLVERGETLETRGKEQVDRARGTVTGMKTVAESYWETFERTLDDQVTSVIHRLGVPTKGEIEDLTRRVEDLTVSIEKLRATPAAKPAAAKAVTPRKATATARKKTAGVKKTASAKK